MYTIIVPNSVKKDLKKLDKPVVKKILDRLEDLSQKPTLGSPLSGNLSELRKLNIYHHKTEYRIVYRAVDSRGEILFDITLRQNPLQLLKNLSRNRTVVAAWNGSVENGYLTYAAPRHPEYRRYQMQDFLMIDLTVATECLENPVKEYRP